MEQLGRRNRVVPRIFTEPGLEPSIRNPESVCVSHVRVEVSQAVVWKASNLQRKQILLGHSSRVLFLCASPSGQNVLTAAADEKMMFWKIWPPRQGRSLVSFIVFSRKSFVTVHSPLPLTRIHPPSFASSRFVSSYSPEPENRPGAFSECEHQIR
jgi:WD40 repeat protein